MWSLTFRCLTFRCLTFRCLTFRSGAKRIGRRPSEHRSPGEIRGLQSGKIAFAALFHNRFLIAVCDL